MSVANRPEAQASHAFLTVAIPFPDDNVDAVNNEIDKLDNPATRTVRHALHDSGIHFLSLTVLPSDGTHRSFLLIEGSFDGTQATAIDTVVKPFANFLIPVLKSGGLSVSSQADVSSLLRKHAHQSRQGLFGTPGVNFSGAPGMTAKRIGQEFALGRIVRTIIEQESVTGTPLEILRNVRNQIESMDIADIDEDKRHYFSSTSEFKALLEPSNVKLLTPENTEKKSVVRIIAGTAWRFLRPLILLVLAISIAATAAIWSYFNIWMGLLGGFSILLALSILSVVFLAWVYLRLRRKERTDPENDKMPDPKEMLEIMQRENKTEQNHLFGISTMKPGRLRRFTLRIVFWIITQFATYLYRPGFLGELGTIHFARWILLPGTNKLLFYSNYGGSWESYLEDFITKAHGGLTGVWSNTEGFPRTKNLFQDGATSGDAFKRWARCQQHPTRFWYSAYPHLTTERIRINAAIRHGLAIAKTEDQASTWLSCIGSRPRPAATIESTDVQGIVFGGLAKLPFAESLLFQLPADSAKSKSWIRELEPGLSFGDRHTGDVAIMMGLTRDGLEKLGLDEKQIQEFSICFQQGMSAEHRAKFLGDTGDDKPDEWKWGHGENVVHAVLLIYHRTKSGLEAEIEKQLEQIANVQGKLVHRIALRELIQGQATREAFGFVDGISQPIIRGARNWNNDADPIDVVEAGEIILGYPDNRGQFPSSPRVPAELDFNDRLAGLRRVETFTPVPTFEPHPDSKLRDLGRNGSYLVIRQLEQNTDEFSKFLAKAAGELKDKLHGAFGEDPQNKNLEEWVAAKMVGRWKDGTSLVRFPNRPGNGWAHEENNQDEKPDAKPSVKPSVKPDNAFLLGEEDPLGYRCPFGAHIRRTNPRDSTKPGSKEQLTITNRHRILRMGRPYGSDQPHDKEIEKPGLLFMCLNADIERQFEFIQQTWAMARLFHGLDGEVDSILSRGGEGGRLTIPTPEGPIIVKELKDFVKVLGGAYFFLPSHRAIRFLGSQKTESA